MTTQQRIDCLLKHFDKFAENQGDMMQLEDKDITLLMDKCGFTSRSEIAFYLRSLDERGLMNSQCSADHTILSASITIEGYCRLDEIKGDLSGATPVSITK